MENDEILPDGEQEEQVTETVEETTEETDEQKDYRSKLNATNRFLQHEGYTFKDGKWVKSAKPTESKHETSPKTNDDGLSIKDSYALQAAGVPFEDVDEVAKAAKVLGKSIPEALKDPIVTARLAQLKSFRETEQATNTKPGRPSAKEVSDDKILEDAAKGIIPKPGTKEAERLFFLRRKK